MDLRVKGLLYSVGGRLFDYAFTCLTAPRRSPIETRIQDIDRLIQSIPNDREKSTGPPTLAPKSQNEGLLTATEGKPAAPEEIATGCLPCALGHFSMSSGLLNEAVRFKGEGMTSNEILDRIAGALEQHNALEREDLSPYKIQGLKEWERPIAEEALEQSRQLRHKLEGIQSIDELQLVAADTKRYYIKLNRQWYKGKFSYLGARKADVIAQRIGGQ